MKYRVTHIEEIEVPDTVQDQHEVLQLVYQDPGCEPPLTGGAEVAKAIYIFDPTNLSDDPRRTLIEDTIEKVE